MRLRPSVFQILCLAAIAGLTPALPSGAQQRSAPPAAAPAARQPSPAALLMARQIIEMKGATTTFDPVITGVIEYHRNLLMETNPNLSGAIRDVAAKMVAEMQSRRVELQQDLASAYAQHFTEQELRDALAFYKTPLGNKLITVEPQAMDAAMKRADEWSRKFAVEVVDKMRAEMKKRGHNLI
jgi:hypothetical protein